MISISHIPRCYGNPVTTAAKVKCHLQVHIWYGSSLERLDLPKSVLLAPAEMSA